jgi:SET domain-containing protein
MMCIAVDVRPSAIEGLGLFARHAVAAGTVVWRFAPALELTFSDAEVAALPAHAQEFLFHYCYQDLASRRWVLSGDNTRFMNHAADPNTGAVPGVTDHTVARRDIAAGEELTCDYFAFDAAAAAKLR